MDEKKRKSHMEVLNELQQRKSLAVRVKAASNELQGLVQVGVDALQTDVQGYGNLVPVSDELRKLLEDSHDRLKGLVTEMAAYRGQPS